MGTHSTQVRIRTKLRLLQHSLCNFPSPSHLLPTTTNTIIMKTVAIVLLTCTFITVSSMVNGKKQKPKVVSFDGPIENSIGVTKGDVFIVELPMDSASGYEWVLAAPVQNSSFIKAYTGKPTVQVHNAVSKAKSMVFQSMNISREDVIFYLRPKQQPHARPVDERLLHVNIF